MALKRRQVSYEIEERCLGCNQYPDNPCSLDRVGFQDTSVCYKEMQVTSLGQESAVKQSGKVTQLLEETNTTNVTFVGEAS